jgi:hypothetical protein
MARPQKEDSTTPVDAPAAPAAPEAHAPLAMEPGTFQSVPLGVWLRQKFGAKFDHGAGFAHWAKKNGHVRNSVPEWEALLAAFNNRPLG